MGWVDGSLALQRDTLIGMWSHFSCVLEILAFLFQPQVLNDDIRLGSLLLKELWEYYGFTYVMISAFIFD